MSKKQLKLARFGGLSPVVQKGYDASMPEFHSPPARKGIYCFIHPYYDQCLMPIAATFSRLTPHDKFEFLHDSDGNRLKYDDYFDEESEIGNWRKMYGVNPDGYMLKPIKPKVFTYEGNLWHHLVDAVRHPEIKGRKGQWVLTHSSSLVRGLQRHYAHSLKAWRRKIADESVEAVAEHVKTEHYLPDWFWIQGLEVFVERIR